MNFTPFSYLDPYFLSNASRVLIIITIEIYSQLAFYRYITTLFSIDFIILDPPVWTPKKISLDPQL
jgi:hypothetical protein